MPSAPELLTRTPTRTDRVYTAMRHAAGNPFIRAGWFSLVALAAMWSALGTANLLNIYQDAQHFTLFEEAARLSVAKFHQLPLWDPYYCGGIAGLGTPSARFASPTFLITLLFGSLRGATLTSFVMTVVGLEGTFRYVRARGGGTLPALSVAPVFALSGLFAHATLVAWTNFFSFELVPWALLGIRLALGGSRRGLVLGAGSIAWMIGFGGTYTAPLTALAAAFEAAWMLGSQLRRGKRVSSVSRGHRLGLAALMGVLLVLLALGLSMVRLWPVAETLAASPRLLGGKPGTSPIWVWRFLFGERSNQWMKADFLIGLPVLPIVILGLWRKRSIAPAVSIALFVWFSMGYDVRASLFAVLRTVPPYTMLRAPERFLIFVALGAATIAALGIRRLEIAGRKSTRFLVGALVCHGLLLGDAVVLARLGQIKADARKIDPTPPIVDRDFRQTRGNRWIAAYYPFMSRGTLTCFDDYDIAQSPQLRVDLPQEEYLKDMEAGTVWRSHWSPNQIDLEVKLTRPARVYINQNWHPGWRSNVGAVVSDDGLLAVDLPEGTHALTLRFWPRSAVGGMAATLLALVVAGFIVWRARQSDEITLGRDWLVTAALTAAPLLVVAISFSVMHEPTRPPPPLLTPSGEPMIVDAPPEDTTPLAARWDNGIVLEAAHVDLEPADETHGPLTTVELDWRFEEKVPPGLGVFIQLERTGAHIGTDHVLLSGAVVPEAAPLHVTVRDVSAAITMPQEKDEKTWKVYAGFWRARRDMTRMKVISRGNATVSADRVLVGTVTVPPQGQ